MKAGPFEFGLKDAGNRHDDLMDAAGGALSGVFMLFGVFASLSIPDFKPIFSLLLIPGTFLFFRHVVTIESLEKQSK